jgi:hypothetical protein
VTVREALGTVRYVVDAEGKKTEAIIPLPALRTLLESWKESLLEKLEDQEDLEVLETWLEKRAAGQAETIPLEELVQELKDDGLI